MMGSLISEPDAGNPHYERISAIGNREAEVGGRKSAVEWIMTIEDP